MLDKYAKHRDLMKTASLLRENRVEQLAKLYAEPQYAAVEVSPFDNGAADIEKFFDTQEV